MVQVRFITNLGPSSDIVEATSTPRQALEKNDIDISRGAVSIDGCPVRIGDLDKTFSDLGITEKCNISVVLKADNALAA